MPLDGVVAPQSSQVRACGAWRGCRNETAGLLQRLRARFEINEFRDVADMLRWRCQQVLVVDGQRRICVVF